MQKEYTKFSTLVKARSTYKNELQNEIKSKQDEILELEEGYKVALSVNDDKKADNKQDKIYNLEKEIERNQDKLELQESGADGELNKQAKLVLDESNNAIQGLRDDVTAMVNEYDALRQKMIDKGLEIKDHQRKSTPYQNAVTTIFKALPNFAAEQSKDRQSKVAWTDYPHMKEGVANYRNNLYFPALKELTRRDIQ